jgi:two-component system response regulator AtoC
MKGPMANTILVVDDDPSSVATLVTALAEAGFAGVGAHGFGDATKMLDVLEPDLVISAVRLGPYNGLHLVVRARALYPNVAAIVIGPNDPGLADEARALGAGAYLPLPSAHAVVLQAAKMLGPPPDDGKRACAAPHDAVEHLSAA